LPIERKALRVHATEDQATHRSATEKHVSSGSDLRDQKKGGGREEARARIGRNGDFYTKEIM